MNRRQGTQRLGKGLGALLGEALAAEEGQIQKLRPDQIEPNPFQPRIEFAPEELQELRDSIRINGLLQPPVVRPSPDGTRGAYQLVAGERRFRCIQELGWTELPVFVRDVDDRTLLVLALVENIQRAQLGPLEEAEGYRVLADNFGLTQAEIAEAVGKNRSTVANAIRLLRLPPSVRRFVESGELSMGHVRALVSVEDPGRQADLARQAVERGWTVREMEDRVRGGTRSPRNGVGTKDAPSDDSAVRNALQEELRRTFSTRVTLKEVGKGKGVVEIPYQNPEEFERIFELLTGLRTDEFLG